MSITSVNNAHRCPSHYSSSSSSAPPLLLLLLLIGGGGGGVAQSVERATPGEDVPGSIPAVAARSLLVGSVSV